MYSEEKLYLFGFLNQNNLIAKVWPVYEWDKDPAVYALIVSEVEALALINSCADISWPLSIKQLRMILKEYRIGSYPAQDNLGHKSVEQELIAEFYRKRKERRITA